ncbi:trypsin-like serine protease [Corynebacterium tapiri]|nr:trypsin-like serine protease [Corynebacterium tapiri]
MLSTPAIAHAADDSEASLQASSPVPVNDNRIAALWSVIPGPASDDTPQIRRDCTASFLGDHFWLTAHHCISHAPMMDGFLQQPDGEHAGIAAIYTMSDSDDVALIKTGDGINADSFSLADHPLQVGEHALLTGYGQTHDFASTATTVITDTVASLDFGNVTYTDLFKGKAVTESRSCSGDSGAPIFKDNTLYAVHTAGGYNPACSDGRDKPMWHTNIVSRATWITQTMADNAGLSPQEQRKAAVGLSHAPTSTSAPDKDAPSPIKPSHDAGLSSWGSS